MRVLLANHNRGNILNEQKLYIFVLLFKHVTLLLNSWINKRIVERIKEHDRDVQLLRSQISAVSEHANMTGNYPLGDEVKFINREPHWYSESRRVNEAIHIKFHPNNINRNSWSGIEIPAYNQTA